MKSGKKKQYETLAEQFQQEFECDFLGSVDTLIAPTKIKNMPHLTPIESKGGLDMYEKPVKAKHMYVLLMSQEVQRMTIQHL